MKGKKIIYLKDIPYERTEDDEKYWFQEISDRKNKVHFTITKDPEKHKIAEEGLRIFWNAVFNS
jgi:benzoyl-CoA reductase/2-hydroxyglutaryl-CoA dehydratase subunit BcrC/BadD/HgdB